jgi:hypothetical protein
MSEYQPKPGTFTLYFNKIKKSEKSPDYKLTAVLPDGKKYEIAGWTQKTDTGVKITGTIQDGQQESHAPTDQPQQRPLTQFAPEDDVPF